MHGKTKEVSVDNPVTLSENFMNYWNAVVVDDEWRLVDCFFAAQHQTGGSSEWELIDDDGRVREKLFNVSRKIPLFCTTTLFY